MRHLVLFTKVVLFLLMLSFAVKNSEPVTLHYLLDWQWQAPLSLLMLIAFALGVMLGLLGCARQIFRQKREISRLRKDTVGIGTGVTG